jgi:glutathione synthase/RimK-type ligase-like ATP-grasp enzyme
MPIGRVALQLAEEGITLVFGRLAAGGRMSGFVAEAGAWRPVADVAVQGAYDRYPSKKDEAGHAALRQGLGDLPLVNPLALTLLCRDKLACQHQLERHAVPTPPVVASPKDFARHLAQWGTGFLKPRFGAFGVGVRRVVPGDDLPTELPGALEGAPEPSILQRAVSEPAHWAGISVRTLVQRNAMGTWMSNPGVARRHRTDPVVNVARGAEAAAAEDVLSADTMAQLTERALAAAHALTDHPDGAWLAELGVDCAIDAQGEPWVIEVNSRPRGRLEALAAADPSRFSTLHLEACARPLRFLAAHVA